MVLGQQKTVDTEGETGVFIASPISPHIYVTLGCSDGDASVFSQRSAATKSSSATGKSGSSSGGNAASLATGKSGLAGIPRAAIEGSAFVIPAQEVA